MLNQFTIQEPRTVTRLVYSTAIRTAISEGERTDLLNALQWYETKWQAQDNAIRKAAQEQPPQPPQQPTAPRTQSAVEQHGHDSAEAEAKRQERRQKRLAAEAAKKEREAGDGGKDKPVAQKKAQESSS